MRPTWLVTLILCAGIAATAPVARIAPAAPVAHPQTMQAPGPQRPPGSEAEPPANQPPAPTQQQKIPQSSETLKAGIALVNVFATVRDKHNTLIPNLKKDDFKILEDGQEQKISFFSKEVDIPITIGLLIDTSPSMDSLLGAEQDTASRFLKQVMRPKDEAMVVSFDFDVDLLADFTEDTALLARAIRRTMINAVASGGPATPGTVPNQKVGGTLLYDAVYLACHDQLATEAGRKVVILMTDADDDGSRSTLKDSIEAAQRASAVVHVLLMSNVGFYFGSNTQYDGGDIARKMAEETGGRVFDVHNEKSLEKAFAQLSEELRGQYILGYYPTNTKRDGAFRKIRVEVSRPDTKILARKGYYAAAQ